MKLILFCHPQFMRSQSMPRFARMLQEAYEARGIQVDAWSPQARFRRLIARGAAAKWAGYLDQYLLFPLSVRRRLKHVAPETLFVFCDQAMGPWIPLVADRPHVVHAHDLLALRSALGDIPENPTSWTGRVYQRFIRRGVRHAAHFISVSNKTREDLHRFAGVRPLTSEVVHNGLNYPYSRMSATEARGTLAAAGFPAAEHGMLLHVGSGQWYKNLRGVIALYACYVERHDSPLPLWCIGPQPGPEVRELMRTIPAQGKVLFFSKIENRTLQALYSHARALLFPSLAEGFGWPLIEAAACGCAALTTAEPPMSEISGPRAAHVSRLQLHEDLRAWASRAAQVLDALLDKVAAEGSAAVEQSSRWAARFDGNKTIDRYLEIYRTIIELPPAGAAKNRRPTAPVLQDAHTE
jgi:glycosyltransferase involved in cell wall biosynthesis